MATSLETRHSRLTISRSFIRASSIAAMSSSSPMPRRRERLCGRGSRAGRVRQGLPFLDSLLHRHQVAGQTVVPDLSLEGGGGPAAGEGILLYLHDLRDVSNVHGAHHVTYGRGLHFAAILSQGERWPQASRHYGPTDIVQETGAVTRMRKASYLLSGPMLEVSG